MIIQCESPKAAFKRRQGQKQRKPCCVKHDYAFQQKEQQRDQLWTNDHREWYRTVYLLSDHWKRLRGTKLASKPNCERCGASAIDVHHVRYRKIFDVKLRDLLSLRRKCHIEEHEKNGMPVRERPRFNYAPMDPKLQLRINLQRAVREEAIARIFRSKTLESFEQHLRSYKKRHRGFLAKGLHDYDLPLNAGEVEFLKKKLLLKEENGKKSRNGNSDGLPNECAASKAGLLSCRNGSNVSVSACSVQSCGEPPCSGNVVEALHHTTAIV